MARGWESKSVEAQIEAAESAKKPSDAKALTPEQIQRLREKETVTLSRTRVLHDIETAHDPRYLSMMKRALKDLDRRLRDLERADRQADSPRTKSS